MATGFLRNSMINEEGGVDPEQFRMDAMFDRMDAIGKGILGLTIQCAQCHDHKFDPLTQGSIINSSLSSTTTTRRTSPSTRPRSRRRRADVLQQIGEIEDELRQPVARLARTDGAIGKQQVTRRAAGVDGAAARGRRGIDRRPEVSAAARWLVPGPGLRADQAHGADDSRRPTSKDITAFRLELLNDPNLPRGGPGRSIQGNRGADRVRRRGRVRPARPQKLKFAKATADYNPPETPLQPMYDDKTRQAARHRADRVRHRRQGRDRLGRSTPILAGATCRTRPSSRSTSRSPTGGTMLTFQLKQDHGGWNSDDNQNHNLGRFRLSVTDGAGRRGRSGAAGRPRDPRHPARASAPPRSRAAVFSYWRTTVPEWKEANERIEELWKKYPEGATQLVLRAASEPRETHVLKRGDFLKPGKRGRAGRAERSCNPLPAGAAGQPADARPLAGRSQLADDGPRRSSIASGRPTSAPASSPRREDFGLQGEPPSHPELLDWLAVEFMDSGWSMKHLHRLIVTRRPTASRRASTPELRERDPYNRLLARGPRLRVEAEVGPRHGAGGQRPARTKGSAGRASIRRCRSSCFSRR